MEKDMTLSRQSLDRYLEQVEEVAGDLLESDLLIRQVGRKVDGAGRELSNELR